MRVLQATPGRWAATLAAATALGVLHGCSTPGSGSGTDTDEPFVTATDPTRRTPVLARCVAADPEGEVMLHPGSVSATVPTLLLAADLTDAENLSVVERAIVRYDGTSQVTGIALNYPPLKDAGMVGSMGAWPTRRPLVGTTLGRGDGQQAVLVAIRLTDPEEPGRLTGVMLTQDTGAGPDDIILRQQVLVNPPDQPCDVQAVAATTAWTR
ncbi:hypothetical protein [Nocardioides sambongensis]|uniref:hypothetical protein n=1 Tax=Nocardioides sambongensis TaxID=2589074 RepID=UPI0011263038|nr:hypothetical protein [Nocardioides sambongensis]